jgi:hypothetical protein
MDRCEMIRCRTLLYYLLERKIKIGYKLNTGFKDFNETKYQTEYNYLCVITNHLIKKIKEDLDNFDFDEESDI